MNKITEALKLAEEALLAWNKWSQQPSPETTKALAAIREALAEPVKQEPVAWMWIPSDAFPDCTVVTDDPNKLESAKAYGRPIIPLYALPVDAKAIRAEALAEQFRDATKMVAEPVKQEPIGYVIEDDSGYTGSMIYANKSGAEFLPVYLSPVDAKAIDFNTWMKHPYTIALNKSVKEDYIPATDAKAIRAKALEEAAKHLAESGLIGSNDCAAAIRGLK